MGKLDCMNKVKTAWQSYSKLIINCQSFSLCIEAYDSQICCVRRRRFQTGPVAKTRGRPSLSFATTSICYSERIEESAVLFLSSLRTRGGGFTSSVVSS